MINYESQLNPQQLDAVLHGDGPCLVLAGAGSGKTRTITYRVAYLLERGVPVSSILLLTFTNKAAHEMLSRLTGLLGTQPVGLLGGTFHAVANRLLRLYADRLGYPANFTILDQDDAQSILKIILKELNLDGQRRRFLSAVVLQGLFSYSRNAVLSLAEVIERRAPRWLDQLSEIEEVASRFAERKRSSKAMDFDDLLLNLAALLDNDVQVRQILSERFCHVLVDEYQDTNLIQARIVDRLAEGHGNLFVVGDDAQSIYSFRAAEIRNILRFPEKYSQTRIFRLENNYRSTPEILSLANEVISGNAEQHSKTLRATLPSGQRPMVLAAANARDEARHVVDRIVEWQRRGLPLSEMAVLFRAAHHSQFLEAELLRRGLPYVYRGGLKFFERAHVKDVLAYLRLIVNPKDTAAWIRVLTHQPGIGLATASAMAARTRSAERLEEIVGLDSIETVGGRGQDGWRAARNILRQVLNAGQQPSNLIRAVSSSDYHQFLEAEYENAYDRLQDLEQLAVLAETAENLETFLQEAALHDDHDTASSFAEAEDRLVLSTIHQAKGLEWEAVFIVHLVEGAFPNPRALEEPDGLAEERRLLYVAMTRPRSRLFLSYPIMGGHGMLEPRVPSVFLEEIPKALLLEISFNDRTHQFLKPVSELGRAEWPEDEEGFYEEPLIVLDHPPRSS